MVVNPSGRRTEFLGAAVFRAHAGLDFAPGRGLASVRARVGPDRKGRPLRLLDVGALLVDVAR